MVIIVQNEKLKAGYKQTEFGTIPEDWKVRTFGEVMTGFTSGVTPSRKNPDFYKGNIRWITSGELNYNVIMDTIDKISEEAAAKTNLKLLPKGTFLIAITGMEAEGTRGSCGIVGAEATTNQHCMALFPTKELSTGYLFHYYVYKGKSLALQYCQGTKQQDYTSKIVKLLPILLPPLPEQQAIATALSDVDALIASLDKLIAKKRDIKQATMQQLLTGKTRLEGFSKSAKKSYKQTEVGEIPVDWEVKKLKEVADFFDGRRRPISERDRTKMRGEYPYYGASGIVDYVNDYIFDEELILLGEDGENILSRSCRLAFRVSGKIWVNNHAHVLKPKEDIDIGFLTEYLESLDYEQYNTGTAQPKLNKRVCSEIPVFLPSFPEQTAIATVLSNMDAEIIALEKKSDKTRALKLGMMQELLTGKTRLL